MKTIEEASSRELEIAQVMKAVDHADIKIYRMEIALAQMKSKQTARRCELVRQQTIAKYQQAIS